MRRKEALKNNHYFSGNKFLTNVFLYMYIYMYIYMYTHIDSYIELHNYLCMPK